MYSNISNQRLSLAQALASEAESDDVSCPASIYLACGFNPLHLPVFLKAHGRIRFPNVSFTIRTGLFDDLIETIERIPANACAAVVVEWFDLDPRLGLRGGGGWTRSALSTLNREAAAKVARLKERLTKAADSSTLVVVGPNLPLLPLSHTSPWQDTSLELELHSLVDEFLGSLALLPNIRVVSNQELDIESPLGSRQDAAMTLTSGYPYTLTHSETLARCLIQVMFPREPLKGLITDLDNTLWRGILGEIGVEEIAWTLETKAQVHGIYQQFLAALADRGVLLAIASKSDTELVKKALSRSDLFCNSVSFFPTEISLGPKSQSVTRILEAWNVAPSDVVFIDDSLLELAEVSRTFPNMKCLGFPHRDPQAVLLLLTELRSLFGRQRLHAEDQIRGESLRTREQRGVDSAASQDDFLNSLDAALILDFQKDPHNRRSFDLVNKTNQFNLNGRRWTDTEWRTILDDRAHFLLTVSYADRFGPLGRIAIIEGTVDAGKLRIGTWVMSCRAFSRRIEYAVLLNLIETFRSTIVVFESVKTERNLPACQFIERIGGTAEVEDPCVLLVEDIKRRLPMLYHKITVMGLGETSDATAFLCKDMRNNPLQERVVSVVDGVQTKLEECFYLVFPELTPETVSGASDCTVGGWDSMATITLISLIGEKFNVVVDYEYFEGATSFDAIKVRLLALLENA